MKSSQYRKHLQVLNARYLLMMVKVLLLMCPYGSQPAADLFKRGGTSHIIALCWPCCYLSLLLNLCYELKNYNHKGADIKERRK
jgi:hypothetical protein